MNVYELNMDGLVGPSHNYAGLSAGNIASTTNALTFANPAAAAHQGIQKMRFLHQLGLKQAVIPPHQRPNLHLLHQLGFNGTPSEQLQSANYAAPNLLSACYSASSMWTANAATVSASADTKDHRVHLTAANLVSNLHRHQEADFSKRLLQRIFADERYFQHHPILPKTIITGDEGAANHSRLSKQHSAPGINLFVYGKQALPAGNNLPAPQRFPARQTLEASQIIARSHQLDLNHVVFACQNPRAIDLGVFHNDVIAVANESLLLVHEDAFLNQRDVLEELSRKTDFSLQIIEVKRKQISVEDAVTSYLFNSQLITLPTASKKEMILVAPTECEQHQTINAFINDLIADNSNPISQVYYLDLKQSMRNGGGPACLRLRVPLNDAELAAMHQGVIVNNTLLDQLDNWVDKHYRSKLHADDLVDPSLMQECFTALDELTSLLNLGAIYPFQCEMSNL
jgi:succinylarginine dihydrolase